MSADRGLLGHIAVQMSFITREQLRAATREQARHPDRRIGEILIGLGFIDDDQLRQLLAAQRQIASRSGAVRRPTPPPVKSNVALGAVSLKRITKSRIPKTKDKPADDGKSRTVAFAMPRKEGARRDSDARKWLLGVLGDAVKCGGTAMLVRPDEPVRVRRFGRLQELTNGPVPAASVERLLVEAADEETMKRVDTHGYARLLYEHPEVGRFRLDVWSHHGGYAGAFHMLPREAPTFEELGLPSALAGLTNFLNGLVLVAGPKGCGKSMTLAAMINLINGERSDHIVTIEDFVECRHEPNVALLSQLEICREVAGRESTVARALAADPDVVGIDTLQENAELVEAIEIAESGHLVLGTVAAPSSVLVIERLIDSIEDERSAACRRVADHLRAIFSPRLLPTQGDGAVAVAFELIYVDSVIANAIRDDQIASIPGIVQAGQSRGSRLLDESLARLVRAGHVSQELAASMAHNPKDFKS